jgi:hypothetical protein
MKETSGRNLSGFSQTHKLEVFLSGMGTNCTVNKQQTDTHTHKHPHIYTHTHTVLPQQMWGLVSGCLSKSVDAHAHLGKSRT